MNDSLNEPLSPPPLPRLEATWRIGLGAALALLCLVVYLPALSAEFVYDDHNLIGSNHTVVSIGAAFSAFFEPLWAFDPEALLPNAFWRPLTVLTLAVTRSLFGVGPEGFHLVSLGLHVLATVATWRLATRLMRCPTTGWLAAALFAVHPVHVESVAWISALNDPLCAFFSLVSLERYLAWRESGEKRVPIVAGVTLLLALLAKEQALALPLIALVIDLVFRHFKSGSFLRAYTPWAAAIGLYYVGRVIAYDGSLLAGFNETTGFYRFNFARSIELRIEALGTFLRALFVPGDYRFFRQVRPELPAGYGPWEVAVIASSVWAVLTAVAAIQGRQLVTALVLVIPASVILLLINMEAAGAFPMSDRYLYLGSAFAVVLPVLVLDKLMPRKAVAGVVLVLCVVSGAIARDRVKLFQDDMSLYRSAVEAEPDNLRARVFVGNELLQLYFDTLEKDYLDEALYHYLTAQTLGYDYGEQGPKLTDEAPFIQRAKELDILINRGTAGIVPDPTVFVSVDDRMMSNLGVGNSTLALAQLPPEYDLEWPRLIFEQILERFPQNYRALDGLGRTYFYMGRYEDSQAAFLQALQVNRTFASAWHNLGRVHYHMNRYDDGRTCFDKAYELRGHLKDLRQATTCAIDGERYPQAEVYIAKFRELYPESIEPDYFEGVMLAKRGDLTGAITRFDTVLAREDQHADAYLQRAGANLRLNQVADAMLDLKKATELRPDSFSSHYQLAMILASDPATQEESYGYISRSYQLSPPTEMRAGLHVMLQQAIFEKQLPFAAQVEAYVGFARLDERRRDFVHALGWVESALGIIRNEFQDLEELPPQARGNVVFLFNLAGELLIGLAGDAGEKELEYHEMARGSFLSGIEIEPRHFFLNYNLATLIFQKLGPKVAAAKYAEVALENIDQLGNSPARRAIQSVLEAIMAYEPEMGPEFQPEEEDSSDDEPK